MRLASLALLLAACAAAAAAAGPLDVQVSADGGKYSVSVGGHAWLRSAASDSVAFRSDGRLLSLSDGSLALLEGGASTGEGSDALGAFREWSFRYAAANATGGGARPVFRTGVRLYEALGAAVFEQLYETGANGTAGLGAQTDVASSFPAFAVGGADEPLGFFQWAGAHLWTNDTAGNWSAAAPGGVETLSTPLEGGPLVLFAEGAASRAAVFSSASNFMSGSMLLRRDAGGGEASVHAGLLGSVRSVSRGYAYRTLLYAGEDGVTAAAEGWGALLLKMYGKRPVPAGGGSVTLSHLAFATDNGAQDYYNPLPNQTYEATVLALRRSADEAGLPVRSLQLDSWFYAKGLNNGVTVWKPTAEVYPDGGASVFNATRWPLMAHNRFWASDTPYAKRWPFVSSGPTALPVSYEFWDWLLSGSLAWGVDCYEQDWLYDVLQRIPAVVASPTLAREWLLQMGTAARDSGLTIQYCMAWPRHALQSVELQAVTQVRASDDYHPSNDQWRIGRTSLLAHALGLAPSKDNFWTQEAEPLNPYNLTERFPELEAAVATLSTGPVQLGDGPGMTNVSLAMRTCAADGTLLKPSRPATAVDATYSRLAFGAGSAGPAPSADVWRSRSLVGGSVYGHVLAANLDAPLELSQAEAGLDASASYVAFSGGGRVASFPLKLPACGQADFQLWHAAPVPAGGHPVLLGDLGKFVPVSPQRFRSLVLRGDGSIETLLAGSEGEAVPVSVLEPGTGQVSTTVCTLPPSGTAVFRYPSDEPCA